MPALIVPVDLLEEGVEHAARAALLNQDIRT
jgi:hypothetical protein